MAASKHVRKVVIDVKWAKQLLSSLTLSATLLMTEVNPAMASTQANLSPAIDYFIAESLPTNFDFDLDDFNLDHDSIPVDTMATTQDSTKPTSPEVKSIDVIARDYEFTPNVLEARAGTRFEITLKNDGKDNHNLTFKTLPDKTETIPSGKSTKLAISGLKAGRYTFYCSVDDHAKRGMTGVLVVSGD